jgi:hypothetical protein
MTGYDMPMTFYGNGEPIFDSGDLYRKDGEERELK